MNKDAIIRMAIECQLVNTSNREGIYMDSLEAFANLVAAHEREACAMVCEELQAPDIYSTDDKCMWDISTMDCAEAIRARSKQ